MTVRMIIIYKLPLISECEFEFRCDQLVHYSCNLTCNSLRERIRNLGPVVRKVN